ncbi:MAG: PQQ-dependent dehydrogenase, methanol/ethanol family [Halieaceae bacterium]|jgi:quinohemoprotein ethanol dehydrogenase|nr:PQQ-dependent dehydrogenase, methanol/ethanol family [Halieaceae bacterium]
MRRLTIVPAISALLFACSAKEPPAPDANQPPPEQKPVAVSVADVSTSRLLNAASEPENWLSYGGSYDEQRHSALSAVNRDTLSQLGVGWVYEMRKPRGQEATPVVVDGVMYLTSSWSIVYALDARTGEELWVYDPEVSGDDAWKGCCDVINRGVAVYEGKVFVGVFDGRLEALDAATGELLWSTVTVDQSKPYTITGAPRVFKDKVLIGNAGGELGVRGYLSAYDVNSGELVWRFYTVPNPEKKPDGAASDEIFAKLANDTWGDDGAWTTDGGGGTVWDSIVYDPVNDQVIAGVGNGSPWNAKIRDPNSDGDNLFLSSILALDADTGAYRWHFQTTPRDQWDYTATQPIVLAELPLGEGGAPRRVVMQAPKNGFFYVLDAEDGEFISGDAFAQTSWATGLDENGRPIEVPAARNLAEDYIVSPGPLGAHNWHPMSYNPDTGLVYIPTNDIPFLLSLPGEEGLAKSFWNIGYRADADPGWVLERPAGMVEYVREEFIKGGLLAWDPVKREPAWAVPYPMPFNGGTLSTASGLVFQGTKNEELIAYDAKTGDRLWSHPLVGAPGAAPMTYEIDGEQYVTVLAGWGSSAAMNSSLALDTVAPPEVGRVITFKIGGEATLPAPMADTVVRQPKIAEFGDKATLEHGMRIYAANCQFCHGTFALSSGAVPDLRWSAMTASEEAWDAVVRDGALSKNGMRSFADLLSKEDTDAVRAYVVKQAWVAVALGEAEAPSE